MFQKGYMGEKLCLVAPDMQELMIDQLDEKSTKLCNLAINLLWIATWKYCLKLRFRNCVN